MVHAGQPPGKEQWGEGQRVDLNGQIKVSVHLYISFHLHKSSYYPYFADEETKV